MPSWKKDKVEIRHDDPGVTGADISFAECPDQSATEPSGARIIYADGSVAECTLIRDPEDDDDRTVWVAMPPAGKPRSGPGDSIEVDVLPPRTRIVFAA